MTFSQGQVVNGCYEILREIGSGTFGTTYHAHDGQRHRDVVIKKSNTSRTSDQQSLLEEIQILNVLGKHPHLPGFYESFFAHDGHLCVVMQYIPGQNLGAYSVQDVGIRQIVAWMCEVLDALAFLHRQEPIPIVHRDVKPDNICIHADSRQAYLLDFGIAKHQTQTRILAVTPPFSPKEQYTRGGTSPASDIYAVGATLYVLLTDEEPPESTTRTERGTLRLPSSINEAIHPELDRIILKSLSLEPNGRYPNAQAMREELLPLLPKLPDKPSSSASVVTPVKPKKTSPLLWWIGGGLISVVIVLVLLWFWKAGLLCITASCPQPMCTSLPNDSQIAFVMLEANHPVIYISRQNAACNTPGIAGWSPDISPDGKQMVFISDQSGVEQLYLVSVAGGVPTRITDSLEAKAVPQWSPDGKKVAFISQTSSGGTLVVIDVLQNTLHVLTNGASIGDVRSLDWSPDSSHLVFSAQGDGTNRTYVVSNTGTDMRLFSEDEARQPDWSPDGRRIVFAAANTIVVMPLDAADGAPQRINAPAAWVELPTWSPDGQTIAYLAGETGADNPKSLWMMRVNDLTHRRLTTTGCLRFAWSPDNAWIACVTDQPDTQASAHSLLVLTVSGEQEHVIAEVERSEISWGSYHP